MQRMPSKRRLRQSSFGALLRRWRQSHHLTQTAFGRLLSPRARTSTVSCWERGIRHPSSRFLRQLVKLTGIPANLALGVQEDRRP
jgi:transcriptional regulator with XRE-family HTH domain